MFPWMIILPFPAADAAAPPAAIIEVADTQAVAFDSGLIALDDAAMSAAAGGTGLGSDITQLALNLATSNGTVNGVNANGSNTGQIAGNLVNGNRGITAVFNNTGNGVIFQNTVQVNLYLNGAGSP